jgi:hypothetical protein
LKDGARSSLPQYLQTNFSGSTAGRDDGRARGAAASALEGTVIFDLATRVFFLSGPTGLSTVDGFKKPIVFFAAFLD